VPARAFSLAAVAAAAIVELVQLKADTEEAGAWGVSRPWPQTSA
jgi:hypothetical protein